MTNHYDIIIVGAGHNGLVAAAYLAKQGKKVLVLERRAIAGGSVVTESFGDGFIADSVWAGGTLRPDIIKDLKLPLPASTSPKAPLSARPAFTSLLGASRTASPTYEDYLVLDADHAKAADAIKRFSEKDATKWPEFVAFMNKAGEFLDTAYSTIMPRLPKGYSSREGYGLLEMGLDLRMMGRKDMINLVRLLPMTVLEFVEEWFESEQLKAAVASVAIHSVTMGVMSAGTGYTLLHNWLNRGGLAHVNVGKAGDITQALANTVKAFGGEIRTETEVTSIHVTGQVAKGVVLANGEEITANIILSSADPKHTFLKLVGPMELPPEFVWHTQSIKMRGSVAKVHLLTDGKHGIPEGTLVVAPTLKYLERAYDAAKYGEISEKPYLEVTTSGNVVSIHFQFAPYELKNSEWKVEGAQVEKIAIDTFAEYFPNLKSSIVNQKSITPLDLEQTYGLTEGDLNHGQLMLDQFLFMRPIPGWSNHKTPIDNLYLCGSGVHGGGGVSGASGRNVVKVLNI
ncbi:MAG: NAD(P)/FAD-dependent oxidoreductase [Chloroflexota bacterium]|nr:NAD(P)/FAD-dependent oxidoreductase [Chloroflexota bacterium]